MEKDNKNNHKDNKANNGIDISKLPILNVGMAGHIDHGKTTLLYALSGKFTDTHSEELKRGITIKLGYSDIILRKSGNNYEVENGEPYRYITFVDVPGHEMLMATMLSGAEIVDVALLVVAANEGIKPQTREHLVALQAKNVKKIAIIQNKIDLVSKEQAIKNYKEIKEFVKGTIAENSEIIPVSAQQKINIDKVYKYLAEIEVPKREINSDPVFVVARSFDINKPGTPASELHGGVLGGSLMKGILKVGDEIEIKPGLNVIEKNQRIYETVKTKIVSLQRGDHRVSAAGPGGSLAIETELDMTLTKADNLSGCVAGLNNKLPVISYNIKIRAQHFKQVLGMEEQFVVEDFKPSEMLMLSINTSISVGRIKTIKEGILDLELNIPVVPFKGDNVGIARNIKGHWRLIGFGEII
ncbi:translation initiation factor IF-2 subunit gamma [Candidatus Pacearchaeota archaeon]|nr:translation initiation factor IF-2 subunit gamma [Candidatus Pacearchaeota archaeon]